jgi:hypothetical protein
MANLYPFSSLTAQRLEAMPGSGGTHRWLAQIAAGLANTLPADACFKFLRQCCDQDVAHRRIPDREIEGAVELAYGGCAKRPEQNFGRQPIAWPDPIPEVIQRTTMAKEPPLFDPSASTGLKPGDVMAALFRPTELVCTGADSEHAVVRPVEEAVSDAHTLQFICVNPMRGLVAVNHSGRPSVRCQNNVALRRFLVAEFDDASLTKAQQALLVTALAAAAPLAMVVDSGGKSLHAWYAVEAMARQDQARFFALACVLGADPTRWDICGWLRMPGGLRTKPDGAQVRQRILYWNKDTIGGAI